jgi:hypothetical protein
VQGLFHMASKEYTPILLDCFVHRHTAISPRMPWVMQCSCVANMGISLSSCTMEREIIKVWETGLSVQSKALRHKPEASDDDSDLVECSTTTTGRPHDSSFWI